MDNKVVITNDSGLVDYSLIDMTVQGGEGYDNLLVATNDSGQINYSLIDMTTGKAANKLVKTLSSGLININLLPASTTGAANTIPKTTSSSSVLSNTWLDKTDGTDNNLDKNKVVVTDSNKQINNNLLNATDGSSTTLANNKDKVVKTNSEGKISYNLIKNTSAGGSGNENTLVKLDANGLLDSSLFRSNQFLPLTGGITTGNIIINGASPASSTVSSIGSTTATFTGINNLKASMPYFTGISGNSYSDGFLLGMNGSSNTNNYLMLATYDEGTEPIYVRQYTGNPGYTGLTQSKSITLMDKDGYTSVLKITSDGDITSTDGSLSVKNNITSTNGNLKISGTGTNTIVGNTTIGNSTNKSTLSVQGKITTYTGIDVLNGGVISIVPEATTTFNGVAKTHIQGGLGGASDNWRIAGGATASDGGFLEIATDDNGDEPIYIRQYKTHPWQTLVRTATILDNLGNTSFPGNLSIGGSITSTGLLTANGGINIPITGDKVVNSSIDANAPLIIGSKTGLHVSFDENEISARSNGSGGSSPLYINPDGGEVSVGHNQRTTNNAPFIVYGKITANNGLTVNNSGASFTGGDISLTNGKISITTGNTVTNGITEHIHGQMAANDDWRIASGATASNSGYVELATADDGSEPIYIRQYTGASGNHFGTIKRTLTLLDAYGNTTIPGKLTVQTEDSSFTGKVTTGSFNTGAIESSNITNTGKLVSNDLITAGKGLTVNNAVLTANKGVTTTTLTASGLSELKGKVVIAQSGDVTISDSSSAPLVIGSTTGSAIIIDDCEIMCKNTKNTVNNLYIQMGNDGASPENAIVGNGGKTYFGGPVHVGGALTVYNNITASDKTVKAGNFDGKWSGFTQQIGSKPSITNDTWILLNNQSNIQHTTVGDISNQVKTNLSSELTSQIKSKEIYSAPATQTLLFGSLTDKNVGIGLGTINFKSGSPKWNTFDALMIVHSNDGRNNVQTTIVPVWELEKRKKIAKDMGVVKYELTGGSDYWFIDTIESTYIKLVAYDNYENSVIFAIVGLKW